MAKFSVSAYEVQAHDVVIALHSVDLDGHASGISGFIGIHRMMSVSYYIRPLQILTRDRQ